MLVRILSAVLLLPLLILILLYLPPVYTAILVAVLSAIAAFELLWGTGFLKRIRPVLYSSLFAVLVVAWSYFGLHPKWLTAGIFLFTILLLAELMADHEKLLFSHICVCFVAGLIIPWMFSSLVRLRSSDYGKVFVAVPFVVSFVADSGAYFAGVFLGKHKLAPKISPKKTIEGLFGGVLASALGMVVFSLIVNKLFGFFVNYLTAVVFGVAGSLVCVFGDLAFSAIKRQTGIKDYGRLIPGHGGVLDRFDSTIFVASMVELFMDFGLLW